MTSQPALTGDAAMVLGLASTAMPFAGSAAAQAERWLRVLRAHGEAGVVLSALGVSEGPIQRLDESGERPDSAGEDDVVSAVTSRAVHHASDRGAVKVATTDVLLAAMDVYGAEFDRVLKAHGTDRAQVVERLREKTPGRDD